MSDAYKKLAYKALNPAHSAFKSKSLQRPYDDHPTPGPGTHTPNFTSVEANMRDSGNSFRSENVRSHLDLDKASHPDHVCGAKSMTSPVIGPGAYYNDHNTLQHGLLLKLEAQSKTKPGFGAKAPARCLPFEHHQNGVAGVKDSLAPGPGDYQPSIWTGHALGAPGVRCSSSRVRRGRRRRRVAGRARGRAARRRRRRARAAEGIRARLSCSW